MGHTRPPRRGVGLGLGLGRPVGPPAVAKVVPVVPPRPEEGDVAGRPPTSLVVNVLTRPRTAVPSAVAATATTRPPGLAGNAAFREVLTRDARPPFLAAPARETGLPAVDGPRPAPATLLSGRRDGPDDQVPPVRANAAKVGPSETSNTVSPVVVGGADASGPFPLGAAPRPPTHTAASVARPPYVASVSVAPVVLARLSLAATVTGLLAVAAPTQTVETLASSTGFAAAPTVPRHRRPHTPGRASPAARPVVGLHLRHYTYWRKGYPF